MLVGNLVSILSGGAITVAISLIRGKDQPPDTVWENTRDIDNPLRPWSDFYVRCAAFTFTLTLTLIHHTSVTSSLPVSAAAAATSIQLSSVHLPRSFLTVLLHVCSDLPDPLSRVISDLVWAENQRNHQRCTRGRCEENSLDWLTSLHCRVHL